MKPILPTGRRRMVLALALVVVGAFGLVRGVVPEGVEAQTPLASGSFIARPLFTGDGLANVVFTGGTVDQLEAAALREASSGVWAQDPSGAFQLLVVGGPAFLKDAFKAKIPGGFSGAVALTLTRSTAAASPASTPAPTVAATKWRSASAPAGATVGGGDWIAVDAPGGKTILAEVFRPSGAGPFPAVVVLHGQAGFSNVFLQTGAEIASAGYVTVVGCWFAGNYDGTSNADAPTPVTAPDGIACPNGPTLKPLTSTTAVDDVSALLDAARTLPNVRADRVALVGNSRGSVTALLTGALGKAAPQAIVAIAGAPPGGLLVALALTSPVLLLQGEADTVVPVANSKALEAALNTLGRPVQSHYYAGAPHGFFLDAQYHSDAITRLTAFLRSTLGG